MTITAQDDDVDAPNKAVTVHGSVSGGNDVSAPADQTLTITDDEATPTVTLVLTPDEIPENGGSSTVTATLDRKSSEDVTMTVTASAESPAEPADFTQAGAVLTIAAGATTSTGTVTITAVNNDVDAPARTVRVSGSVSGGNNVTAPAARTLTITDDEDLPTLSLELRPSSIGENGGESTVTAALTGASSEDVTVTVSTSAVSPATSSDFTQSGTTLTIKAGLTTSTGTVRIAARDNDVDAPDKQVTVSGSASGGNDVLSPSDQTLTITDDEATPTVTLVLTPDEIPEDGGVSTVTATLNRKSSEAVTVTVSTSAVSPATSADFTQNGTSLTIAAGSTTSTGPVTITAQNNGVDAPNKTVTVSGSVTGGNDVPAPADRTLTITDDEGAPTVRLVLTPDEISENGGVSTVTAELTGASSQDVTVTVSSAGVLPATSSDFDQSGTTLIITAGQTDSTGTVTITAEDNDMDGPKQAGDGNGHGGGTGWRLRAGGQDVDDHRRRGRAGDEVRVLHHGDAGEGRSERGVGEHEPGGQRARDRQGPSQAGVVGGHG